MTSSSPLDDRERVRTAEIVSSLCLATDLGMGFPFEHGFHATLMAACLADLLEVDMETKRYAYYFCLLDYVSCTTDAYGGAEIFAGEQTENVIPHLWGSSLERTRGVMRAMPPPDANPVLRVYEMARRIPRALAGTRITSERCARSLKGWRYVLACPRTTHKCSTSSPTAGTEKGP